MANLGSRIKVGNLLARIPYFARQMVDEAGKHAVYLQLLIITLLGFRGAFAIISLTRLEFMALIWNLIIIGILLIGYIAAKSRNQLILLCYVAVIGAVMVLSMIDFLIAIVTNLFKFSIAWQIVIVISTSIHLMLEAGSVMQAWKVYRLLTTTRLPQVHFTLPAEGVTTQATYMPGGDAELGYEMKERPQDEPEAPFEEFHDDSAPYPQTGQQQQQSQQQPQQAPPAGAYPPAIGSTPYGLAPSFTPAMYEGQPPQGGAAVTATSALYPITYDSGQ